MSGFSPIDHKDSDREYRSLVRTSVEGRVGGKLRDITSASELVGDWVQTPTFSHDGSPTVRRFHEDGTCTLELGPQKLPEAKWRILPGVFVEETWCDPMPDYGIDEGCWSEERYHCALCDDGRVVYWNGDSSLLVELQRQTD